MKNHRLIIWLTFACLATLMTASAQAQTERVYRFFVAPEFGFVISPEAATDYYSSGFGLSAGLEYPLSPNWSFIGMLSYKTFSPDEGIISDWWTDEGEWPGATNISVSEGSLSAFTFAIVSKGSLKTEGSSVWPYVKGGFGLTVAGAEEIKVDFTPLGGGSQTAWQAGADSEANLAILLGLGVEIAKSGGATSFFAEVGFEIISMEGGDNPGVIPIRVGLKF